MGDLFADRLNGSRNRLKQQLGDKYKVDDNHAFSGFDAFEKVIASDVDLVLFATPPAFRPQHIAAAVAAGKHVFAEKPVAVDPTGVRSVMASAKAIDEKGLNFVCGTQRRHQKNYLEVMKRIHGGALGEVLGGQCYWNMGTLWVHKRKEAYTDTEWQIRNWLYFTFLSGDHIVEQHVHNLDVMNWAVGQHPSKATGMGGRQVRTGEVHGNIFDHFAIDYEYASGARVQSYCRQTKNCANRVGEYIIGTEGNSNAGSWIRGETNYKAPGGGKNPYVQEHTDLIHAIRTGKRINEAQRIAESTLTAIMGRMSAYTGKAVTWEKALNSKLDLVPQNMNFGELAVRNTSTPGRTKLV
jgi:predicted dehydrogenase